jgi:hypothetical protein
MRQSAAAICRVCATGQPLTGLVPVSPQAQALLNLLYPLPNVAGNSGYNYQAEVQNHANADSLQLRLDKPVGRKDYVYGRFGWQSSRSDSTSLFHFRDATDSLGLNTSVNWQHRFRGQLLMKLGFDFSRLRTNVQPQFAGRQNISGQAGIAGNDQDAGNWGPPTLVFTSGIAGLTDGQSEFNRNRTDSLSLGFSKIQRRHTVSFGSDFRRREFNEFSQQDPRGIFTFTGAATAGGASTGSDLADFLLGIPDTSALAYGNADKYFRQSIYDAYVSDDWRARPELSINAGLRWDYGAPPTELFGRLVNLDIAPGFGAVAPVLGSSPTGPLTGAVYPPSLVRPDKRLFEPRIGIAWRPLPASTLVVRAGYGMYTDTSVYLSIDEMMAQQAPLSRSLSVANSSSCPLTLANGFPSCPGATTNTFAIDPNFRIGYVQTWRLQVQHDLPGALVMTATYLGIKGTHGMQESLPNTYPLGAANPCPACPAGFLYMTSGGNSTREAGEIQLRRRLRRGLSAKVNYTYSKSIDDDAQLGGLGYTPTAMPDLSAASTPTATPAVAQNWLNLRAERGLSNFDQRHLVKGQLQYTPSVELARGNWLQGRRGALLKEWTFLGTISAGSGLPETPVYWATVPGAAVSGTIRPDLTGAPLYAQSDGHYLNAGAYSVPVSGQWGTARRNSIAGPNQFSLNASLSRTFRLQFSRSLDIRLDAANLLNHPVFTSWNNVVNSVTFGLPASVNSMRTLRLTGRLSF